MGDFNRHADVNNGEFLDGKEAFLSGMGQERLLGGRRMDTGGIFFSSHLQSFAASVSFPMNQFFASGGQSIGASASVLPMNIQD